MVKWTTDQKNAIDFRDCNLLVSAAAGSGKTAVLVQRIIDLIIKDKIDIDRLLIVTFTKAAAGEMRERIQNAIAERIEKKDADEKHLRKQLSLLNKASITTVHSFCINVVRKNFHILDIDPGFRIGDVTETNVLIKDSLEEVLEQEYEKKEEKFINLVESYSGNRGDERLQKLVLKTYFFIQSKPYPFKWLEESVNMFDINKDELMDSIWVDTIKSDIKLKLNGAIDVVNKAKELSNYPDGPYEYIEGLDSDLENVKKLKESLEKGLDDFYLDLNNISHKRFPSIRGERKKEVNSTLLEEVKDLRNTYKRKIIDKLKGSSSKKSTDDYLKEITYLHPLMEKLMDLVKVFKETYQEKKLDRGILDFNDLEHFALKVLENEDIKNFFRKKYEYIFVDEYQDSNLVQETIINRIKRDNNLFLVGDVKQSIYRFRLADPSLFLEKYKTYHKNFDNKDIRIDLSRNFRSRLEILEGINFIFKNIMSEKLGEIEYTEDNYLYKGIDFDDINEPEVELNILERETEDLDIDEELEELSQIEVEAKFICKKIKELKGKETYDPKKGHFRDINYRDIVILLRSTKSYTPVYEEIFNEEGIPLYADSNTGYFDVIEIQIFLNLLKLIDNKRQDIPLLSVMRSPIGKFKTKDLINIRSSNDEDSFYKSMEKYIEENDNKLSDRLKKFIDTINEWIDESKYLKLDEFIWKLLIETGFYHYVGAMPGGLSRQANLRILVDRANQLENTSINGLFNFIRFITRLNESDGDMGTAKTIGENENVVRIMSIHKSKGLEFPVVFVGGLGKKFNLQDTQEDVLMHKDLGLGPKFVDLDSRVFSETLPQLAIKKKMKTESLSEEMRILYVALTRAVDKLILLGSVKGIENKAKKWNRGPSLYNLVNCNNYLDWVCSALVKHSHGKPLREIIETNINNKFDDNDSKWKINIYNRKDILTIENKEKEEKNIKKEKLINFNEEKVSPYKDIIDSKLNWEYDNKTSVKIPSKISVTDIKNASSKNLDDINYKIPMMVEMPQFVEKEKEFTRAERGTIIHFVMQHLDLKTSLNEKDLKRQIDILVNKELLTEEEADVVDLNRIKNFFKSDIGKRMLNSESVFREAPFVLRKKACDVIEGLDECKEDILIQGIIDCYFKENDSIILLDYKTDLIINDDTERIKKIYTPQLRMYKEALEKITKQKVKETYIYLFNIDKYIKIKA
ncbi:MAG: helicase-exonuclease AddAB subunit AddA [Firmicutes bacterium]|nr:helicase-exonuclease AddAB subunit AddA [Bacillota bacterium]